MTQSGLEEPDPVVTQPPSRRPSKARKPPKLPAQPSFDRPEEATTSPPETKRVRKRKPREKQPPKSELQPRIHRAGQQLKTT
ncbi:MAG: hypothetical protein WEE89_17835 [Gemmatimonadota bacterium]